MNETSTFREKCWRKMPVDQRGYQNLPSLPSELLSQSHLQLTHAYQRFFFAGNTDQDTVVYHNLSSPIRERYIRFRPPSWIVGVSMRVKLYGFLGEVKFRISENSWVVQQMICNSLIFYPLCERYRALFNFVFLNI